MSSAALVLAWLASLAPLLLERAGFLELGSENPEAAPRLALCSLAWIAMAGSPRAGLGIRDLRAWWGSCMACVPVLALALALDVAGGTPWSRAASVGSWAFSFVVLSALAADLARSRLRSLRAHALLWIALVLAMPLLDAAFSFGARATGSLAPDWIRLAAQSSPLRWALAAVDGSPSPFAPLVVLIGLCALAGQQIRAGAP